MALTGKFTFRKSLRGKIILQLEEEVKPMWRRASPAPPKRRWRDATLMDLAAPELRALIDLRFKPQFRFQGSPLAEPAPLQRDKEGAAAIVHAPGTIQPANGELRRTEH
jgi:hypothetical protein